MNYRNYRTPHLSLFNILLIVLLAVLLLWTVDGHAQVTNTVPPPLAIPTLDQLQTNAALGVLSLAESYLVDNDPLYDGWESNAFSLNQSAVFSDVKGVAGASTLGNDLGVDIPIHKYNISIDEVTRFEQLFGDVGMVEGGVQYNYNDYQVQMSGGIDIRDTFQGHRIQAVPYVQIAKASTGIPALSPFARYEFPISSHSGAGELKIGLVILIGKKLYGAAVK